MPTMRTDAEAEALVAEGLSGFDFRAFKLVRFEFGRKNATVNMRMPAALFAAIKLCAAGRVLVPAVGQGGAEGGGPRQAE